MTNHIKWRNFIQINSDPWSTGIYRCGLRVELLSTQRSLDFQHHTKKSQEETQRQTTDQYAPLEKHPNYKIDTIKDSSISSFYKLLLSKKIIQSNKGTANDKYEILKKCLQEAAFKELGGLHLQATYHPWFEEAVKEKTKKKKEEYQKWLSTKCPEDKQKSICETENRNKEGSKKGHAPQEMRRNR